MSLKEEMWKYEQITGESAEHIPIIKLGAFLDGYEMGIEALEQQSCEDCISRADVLDLAKKGVLISNSNYQSVCKAINKLPSVISTRKKAMWEFEKSIFDNFGLTVICPSCRKRWKTYDEIRWKKENRFCPNCGTEMEVQE